MMVGSPFIAKLRLQWPKKSANKVRRSWVSRKPDATLQMSGFYLPAKKSGGTRPGTATLLSLMRIHHFLRGWQATTAASAHRHVHLHFAQRRCAAIQGFANLVVGNAVTNTDVHRRG
jgi:hypothetical protein